MDAGNPAARLPAPQHVAFAALRHIDFRWLFVGNATAMMADNIEHVISYWVMYQQFHSARLGGFAVISHWVPYLLFSGYSGVLAARYNPRRMIQIGMLMFMGVSVSWGILIGSHTLQIWHAWVLLSLHGFAGVLWGPPAQLLIHDVVPNKDVPSAVRLSATARYVGTLLGPAVGSALMLWVSPAHGILINALIYLPMLLSVGRLGLAAKGRAHAPALRGLAEAVATLRAVRGERIILAMMVFAGSASLLVGNAYQALMPGYALELGHGNPGFAYWALAAADAAGALIGAIILESRGMLPPRVSSALILGMLWCCALITFALTRSYPVSLAALFCAGFLELAFSAMAQALVQLSAPVALRGPVIGAYAMVSMGLRFVSGFTVGIMGGIIGIHQSLAGAAAVLLVVIASLWRWQARRPAPMPA